MFLRAFIAIFVTVAVGNAVAVQALLAQAGAAASPTVLKIHVDNLAITPISARFIDRAIRQAEQDKAECLVIVLDTPGGLIDSTRSAVRAILGSEVPVVVYVAPSGARAASAGVFITLAAHVAAMAPGTNIGAAHPVQIGGLPTSPPDSPAPKDEENDKEKEPNKDSPKGKNEKEKGKFTPAQEKLVNDTVAWARSLAELRGRNVDWVVRAVRESISATATEAVKEGAVDLLADDVHDLLRKIDGREIKLPRGKVVLDTGDARIQTVKMWWGERILTFITNPNVALLLLMFGFYGVLFELYAPGWGIGGTLGVICLLLAMLALAVLPINVVGVALVSVALALFVAEVFFVSYGALTVGGIVCLTLGATMLVDSPVGFLRISLWTVLPIALATGLIVAFLVGSVVKAHRASKRSGDVFVGAEAVARERFSPAGQQFGGMVEIGGELWQATSAAPVAAGERLRVQSRQGLSLRVQTSEDGAAGLSTTSQPFDSK